MHAVQRHVRNSVQDSNDRLRVVAEQFSHLESETGRTNGHATAANQVAITTRNQLHETTLEYRNIADESS